MVLIGKTVTVNTRKNYVNIFRNSKKIMLAFANVHLINYIRILLICIAHSFQFDEKYFVFVTCKINLRHRSSVRYPCV